MTDLERLAAFIRSHDNSAIIQDGAVIAGASLTVYGRDPGFLEYSAPITTFKDARDWLGY